MGLLRTMSDEAGHKRAPRNKPVRAAGSGERYDYTRYETVTGPLVHPGDGPTRVRLQRLDGGHRWRALLAFTVLIVQALFVMWLVQPHHAPELSSDRLLAAASIAMAVSIVVLEVFRLVNIGTLCLASALARDPVPMEPEPGLRVAFLTTIVPDTEPLDVVRRTLKAARRIRHQGPLHVWLLDEGDDPRVRAMCLELGVHHFTRRGVERWNQSAGRFRARTKHGNYNAWLDAHGGDYDVFVSVDPDHVPRENFCERLLGYFRDADVAFAVAPQVYGNYDDALVTKCAESQQFVFHGLVQRMGNAFGCPMFVGTNNAVRIAALREIGGLQDSITEDMATSLALHARRNPLTGGRWRSVYTPDVVAVGEGPATFTDFFSQQHRWSSGAFGTLKSHFWRCVRRMDLRRAVHHALLTAYYPSAAIGWVVGAVNCVLYLALGTMGVRVGAQVWAALYLDLAFVQYCLYTANRKHNVSPHEPRGSAGAAGMLISVLTAPIYVRALIGTLLPGRARFVVTPKGAARSVDRLATFRWQQAWASLLGVALVVALVRHHDQEGMLLWAVMLLGVCLGPMVMWRLDAGRRPRLVAAPRTPAPARPQAHEPHPVAERVGGAA
jgi:cellulose synthase/poly-beta-1,6-N-acetylglucosamine synthase-like glycosyltransferase